MLSAQEQLSETQFCFGKDTALNWWDLSGKKKVLEGTLKAVNEI